MAELSDTKRALLARLASGSLAGKGPTIPRVAGDGPFPLSYHQERVWFLSQLAPGSPLFTLMVGVRMPYRLDPAEVRRQAERVAEHHDMLRAAVRVIDDEPQLVVVPDVEFTVPVVDRSDVSDDDVEDVVREEVRRIGGAPYRLADAPLWRAAIVELPRGEQMVVLGCHHIAIDGISLTMLARHLMSTDVPPRPMPIRYGDFATWQKRRDTDSRYDEDLAYWRDTLADLPPPLDLTHGRTRREERTLDGAIIGVDLTMAVADRLRGVADELSATPYLLTLAAYFCLLAKYSHREDIIVGAPASARVLPELAQLIGNFGNIVPLRAKVSGQLSFRELVTTLTRTVSDALNRQSAPYETLVTDLGLGGSRAHPPLTQVGFNMPSDEIEPAFRLVRVPFSSGGAQLDLTLHIRPLGGNGYELLVEYATGLFDERWASGVLRHYRHLLAAALADPDTPIAALPLLPDDDRAALLARGEPTAAPTGSVPAAVPAEVRTLPALLAEQVARTPSAVAIIDHAAGTADNAAAGTHAAAADAAGTAEAPSLTYAELDARVTTLARVLTERGVRAETVVGVLLAPGIDQVVALLAIWRAGGAYLPLDPDSPDARTEQVIVTANPALVITDSGQEAFGTDDARDVVDLETLWSSGQPQRLEIHNGQAAGQFDDPPPERAAYVIATSGSTGTPKCVVVTHGGIANRVTWTVRTHRIGPADRVLQKTAFTFDAAAWEILAPLVSGGCVVIAPRGAARDPALMLRAAAAHDVTILQVVPSVLRLLVDTLESRDVPPSRADRLRLLFCAGEPLNGELCARLRHALGRDLPIVNTYGPTECAIDVTAHDVGTDEREGPVPIGRPIDATTVRILGPHGEPAPEGVAGQLCVSGPGVARGYAARPDLTAAAFVADPHGPPGTRTYLTGDLAAWRADGGIDFLGRADQQVKVNGVRVELGDVEAAARALPEVRSAAVTARPDGHGSTQLVAYLVTEPGVSTADVHSRLAARLPAPVVPTRLVSLPALPLTPSGKIDRQALPEPTTEHGGGRAPCTETERTIAAVWADLLDVESITVDDDFFRLGGHSLLLTRLAARLRSALDVELTAAQLFTARTVAAQARTVATAAGSLPPIRAADRDGVLPLSAGQHRLWFLQQLDPDATLYNVPVALLLTGPLDVVALRSALDTIVARHEVLRTRFRPGDDGVPHQVIADSAPVALPHIDVRDQPDPMAEARRLVEADLDVPFDLATDPPLRGRLITTAEQRHVLGITFHHVVTDGWSVAVFRHELSVAYSAYRDGETCPLPPLPVQYADYTMWQHERIGEAELLRQADYWRERLADLPTMALPTDRPRGTDVSTRGAYRTFTVSVDVANGLRQLARDAGASLFMTLLAAFKGVLVHYTGQSDVVVGSTIAGRDHPDTEGLIGFFSNTLVLRTDLAGDPTVTEALARVADTALGAYANPDLPFERVVEQQRPDRDPSRHPLFQIMFEMLTDAPDFQLAGLDVEPWCDDIPWHNAKFDLTIEVSDQRDGTIGGYVEYATDLFDADTIARLVENYTTVLTAFAADPDQRLSDLPVPSPRQRRVLTDWARGPADHVRPDEPPTVLTRFLDVVATTPDAPAVVDLDGQLTYAELDAAANRLARWLRTTGIRDVVGIGIDGGCAFTIAVVAAFKARLAYLPLDPRQPATRIGALLSDAGALVVLTTVAAADRFADESSALVVAVDDPAFADDVGAVPDSDPGIRPRPGDPAYVIYTSGSTGTPKGVVVDHDALARSTAARLRHYDAVDRFLLLSPVFFDSSVAGLFWTLSAGGTLVFPPAGPRLPDELAALIAEQRVTHLLAVPSLLAQLADWQVNAAAPPLRSLSTVISAGEACPADLARRMADLAPTATVHNEYGPTEATVWATAARLSPSDSGPTATTVTTVTTDAAPPIGRPVGHIECHVLDVHLRPVPIGVTGELCIGGALARGYLGAPAATAARFVANPLGSDGSRLYRTGDLARWRADGHLEFLGRTDRQLTIAGVRVEPAEAEAVLTAHPDVSVAAVLPDTDSGPPRLVAYVAPVSADTCSREELVAGLRARCAAALPDYLTPARFVVLDTVPLTPNGKLDRQALPRQTEPQDETTAPEADDLTDTERRIADIFADELGKPVGRHEDFFALGGHSLQAVRIATRLHEEYAVELPLRRMFEATTVAALAELLASAIEAEVAAMSDEDVLRQLADD